MTTQEEFEEIVKKLVEIRRKKNHDYGDGFMKTYDRYGEKSIFFDLLRKWQRIETILFESKKIEVSDETIQDTLGDLAVMCVNAMIWLNHKKENGNI